MAESGRANWQARVLGAVLCLLVVAAGARLVWWLIEPLVPWLLLAAGLWVAFMVAFGGFRR